MHGGNLHHVRSGQHSQGNVDHLQILGSGRTGDLARPGTDVVDDRVLEPRDPEMQSFRVDVVLNSADAGKDDGAVTSIDWKKRKAREY